jgi:hypothetical protein
MTFQHFSGGAVVRQRTDLLSCYAYSVCVMACGGARARPWLRAGPGASYCARIRFDTPNSTLVLSWSVLCRARLPSSALSPCPWARSSVFAAVCASGDRVFFPVVVLPICRVVCVCCSGVGLDPTFTVLVSD